MKNTMKKISMFAVGALAVMAFPSIVNAQPTFNLNCGNKTPSDVTASNPNFTCSLSVQADNEVISAMKVKVLPDNQVELLTGNGIEFDSSNWIVGNVDSNDFTTLQSMTNDPITSSKTIATINAKMKGTASHCGKLCVYILYTNAENKEVSGTIDGPFVGDNCSTPTPKPNTTTTTRPTTPETGGFSDYAILIGGAAIAIATVSIARRSTKFYRV